MTNLFKKAIALSLALLFGLYATVAPLHIEAVARPGDPAQAQLIFDVPKFLDQYNGGVEYVHENVWSLTKTATPTTLNLLHGTQGSVNFVVTATKQTTSSFSITYYVYIEYPTQTFDGDVVFDLQAVLSNPSGSNVFATETVENDYVLLEGNKLEKNYTTTFTLPGDANASTYSPMKIAITLVPGSTAAAQTTKSAAITFKGAPTDVIDEILYVYDDMYDNPANDPYDWMFTANGTVNYNKTFSAGTVGVQQSFTNTVTGTGNDGGSFGPASATVIINTTNGIPLANNDNYSTNEDTLLSVAAPGVLLNDSDPDGDAILAVLVSGPTHGDLVLNANGSFTYMPDPNYFGSDSFTYKVNDGFDDSNVATVSINIGSVNDAPVALNDIYAIDEDGTLVVPALGVLGNDTDTEGSTLSAALVTGVSHGTLLLNSDGSFTYTPNANYFGSDSFTYQANDGLNDSNIATVNITVNPINDAPVAVGENYSTNEDVALDVPTLGVLANDSDIDGNTLTAILVSNVFHGSLTLYADGSFLYIPDANYFGPDSFTYKANDGTADSNTVTVSITVNPINDAPVAVEDNYSVDEDQPLIVALPGVLINDTDVESDILSALLVSDVAHGTLTLNANGSFTYVPNANYFGPDSFTYKANDGAADSNTVTVSITVNPINDAPVAVDDNYSTDEDVLLSVLLPGVLGNDTDLELNPLTAILVSNVSNGTLTLNADGSFTYLPAPNFHGTDSFTYKANDGSLDSNIATVTINVGSVNDAPVAVDDSYSIDEDNVLTVINPNGVLANDSDNDMDILHAVLLVDVAHGTLVLNADGTFTYTPDANYFGPDSFTYQANDGLANSNVATVNITVNPINDAPVANDDNYSTDEDTLLTVILPGVLSNDTDTEGDALTLTLVTNVSNGILVLNPDGSFTYLPAPNFTGNDSFTYKVNDGTVDSNVATVTINVGSVNDAPVAVADSYSINEDTLLTVVVPGVLGNDSDNDGDVLTAIMISDVAHGTLVLNADGSFTYMPDANYFGPDSFTYQANDGLADSNMVTVSITVNPINDAPIAQDDNYSINEDTTLNVDAPGVLTNDSDVDGPSLSLSLLMNVTHGSLTFNADGSFSYIPNANFNGIDTFTYTLSDGTLSDTATVTITVNAINDAPVAVDDVYVINEDSPLSVPASGVMDNDSDVDGPSLNVSLSTDVTNGTLTLNPDGSFEYTPNANFNGVDSFTYTLTDGTLSDTATVTITINAVNDAPVAVNDNYSINEDATLTVPVQGVLGNDSDIEGSAISAILVTDVSHGTLTLNADGSFSYIPDANYFGPDSFTYKVNDGTADSNTATVSITVNPINDAPVAVEDNYSVDEDQPLIVALPGVLINDTDVESDILTAILVSEVSHGTLTLNADGSFTYTPDANYFGPDSFTYKANDGAADSNTVTVSITVNPVNDAPVAVDDNYSTDEDALLDVVLPGVLGNDTDIELNPLTAILVSDVSNGTLTLNADGSFSYLPNPNFFGTDSFTYKANDGSLDSNIATVSINVGSVNDAPVAVDDSYSIDEDNVLTVIDPNGVLANDSDNDMDPLDVALLTGVAHGTLVLNADGTFTYTPDANYFGPDSFTYQVNDGLADSNVATVSITVNSINDAPVAEDDAYSTNEEVELVISAPGILANDVDVDSIFTIEIYGQPANGTVVVQPDGSFVYTPDAEFNGIDSFTYGITDGVNSDSATVTITVNLINDAPTADDKTLTVAEGGTGSGLFTGLDGDDDILTFKILTQPANGSVSFNATTGTFTYTHNGGETTSDSFTYAVNDGTVDSAAATVSIIVTPVNDAPTAAGATYTVQIASVFTRTFIRGDVDGDALTISIVNGPDRGAVSIVGGQFTYTHDGVTLDSDFFTFRVFDGQAYSPIRTININFTELPFVNTAPEVIDADFETEFETALNETVGDLGSDFDNDPLTFTLVTQPAHGTVTLNADGTFRYVPDNDYEGDDSFTYQANDGTDDSNIATITITVGEEIIIEPEPTPEATLPWWWLLGLLPFLLFLIRRPRPEVQDVALNPDGTITTTWGYLGPRLMHKDYDRDESILEVVSGEVKVLPPVETVPYEFDRGRHENIFKTVSDKNAVIRWTIKKKAEELDKELIEKMLKKNQK